MAPVMRLGWMCVIVACRASTTQPSAARIAADAVELVDGWALSIGGRDRLAAMHVVHTTGTWTSEGTNGTYESWDTDRGEHRYEVATAGIRKVTLYDGEHGWAADPSGLVVELDGPALEQLRTSAFLDSFSALVPGRLAGEVTRIADNTLQLAVTGSRFAIKVELDPVSHRPLRVTRIDDGEVTTELDDWRDVDGVKMPFRSRSSNGLHQTIAIDQRSTSFAQLADRRDDVRFERPSPIAIPLELVKGSEILVTASINGSPPATFILDSGAPTLLDPDRLPGAGLTPVGGGTMSGTAGISIVGFARDVMVDVRGLAIGKYTVRTASMAATYPDEPVTVAGILGTELFQRVVVEIDYAANQVRFHDARSYQHPSRGTKLPFVLFERSPLVEVALEAPDGSRVAGSFVFDTGCDCELIVASSFVTQHDLIAHYPEKLGDNAAFTSRRGGKLVIGSLSIAEPALVLTLPTRNQLLTGGDTAGFIGGRLMSRYRVTFDYKHRQIWLD